MSGSFHWTIGEQKEEEEEEGVSLHEMTEGEEEEVERDRDPRPLEYLPDPNWNLTWRLETLISAPPPTLHPPPCPSLPGLPPLCQDHKFMCVPPPAPPSL